MRNFCVFQKYFRTVINCKVHTSFENEVSFCALSEGETNQALSRSASSVVLHFDNTKHVRGSMKLQCLGWFQMVLFLFLFSNKKNVFCYLMFRHHDDAFFHIKLKKHTPFLDENPLPANSLNFFDFFSHHTFFESFAGDKTHSDFYFYKI